MHPALSAQAANLLRISARLEPPEPHADVERELHRALVRALEAHPAWFWLREIRAIPRLVSAQLLARLDGEVAGSSSPAAFWEVCGLGRRPYDAVARAACAELGHRISSRQGGYRSFFRATLRHLPSDPDRRRRARAEVEKLFLEHLWTTWRARLGLPGAPEFTGAAAALPEFRDPWRVTAISHRDTEARS